MSRSSIELVQYPEPVTQPPSLSLKGSNTPPLNDTRPINPPANAVVAQQADVPGKGTTTIVLLCVVCITGISSLLAGLVTVGLPTMAHDLRLEPNLLLWPVSIYALTCGCTLLLLGSVADVVGSRPMYLTGCVLQSGFTLACGLAQDGMQLIVFRAFAGIAISFCLPSAVSIITTTFPEGKSRNIAFASMGGGQPIGFSLGLTLGGVFSDTIGWRWGFHIAAIINTIIFVVGFFGLPKVDAEQHDILNRLKHDIDWFGAIIAISIILIPVFIFWVGRQEKLGRPAIIPNSLWRNRIFTSICIGVFLTWGVFNAIETFLSLFFQDVQEISAIQSSIRFLPAPISGALANLVMGLIAHKVRADWAVLFGTLMTCLGALLMAVIQPQWTYWVCAFPAMFLNPIGADALFTVSNLVITSVFPARTQALAGGVFNTIAQIGKSVGLATSAVIASSVTAQSGYKDKEGPLALMEGFRAAFWYCFALSCATGLLFAWGLRGIGRVGVKRE
ncbi:MFS general substrate transporter [Lindgomyces ingoldianus]|uniref:MFS general substrate transporter n=1 Tax=Lindgomyces ingoldianus TaxID=673940 RepID=A0ACB6RFU5_9PLEO|nr:MFS general substrate transporter [Lindgomyces ingoldianus]KAF2478124.1 MFS general substrate transporter [Lindgomyces ingoldianus]